VNAGELKVGSKLINSGIDTLIVEDKIIKRDRTPRGLKGA